MSWARVGKAAVLSDAVLEALGCETVGSRLRKLEATLPQQREVKPDLAELAKAKLDRGQPLTRREAAKYIGVDPKKLQRMEAAGTLQRCPELGTVVRYAAHDVLRLASAQRKER